MDAKEKEEIISAIKKKPELSGIPNDFVLEKLNKVLRKTPNAIYSASQKKDIMKQVRAELRTLVGQFQNAKKRKKYLEKGDFEALLHSHASTRERLPYYGEVRNLIRSLHPKSILDIGCGLNPLAIARDDIEYYATDINTQDLEIVDQYFKQNSIKGKVFFADLTKTLEFPPADVCLLFKVLDIIEHKGHKRAEAILKSLRCPVIVASFPLKTLSGSAMRHPQRGWIERLANRLNYQFSTLQIKNEIFYIIHKPL